MGINDSNTSVNSFYEFMDSFTKGDMLKISGPYESEFITSYNNNDYYMDIPEGESLYLELTGDLSDYGGFYPQFLVQKGKEFIRTEGDNNSFKSLDQYDNPKINFERDIIDVLRKLYERGKISRIGDENIASATISVVDVTSSLLRD